MSALHLKMPMALRAEAQVPEEPRPSAPAHVAPPDVSLRLPRPRLLQRLATLTEHTHCSAVWLAACTGSGKTTLAAAFASTRPTACWLRLDSSDRDPATLAEHLGEALEHARGLAPGGARLPTTTREQWAQPERALRTQFRALCTALPSGCVLALDDLQAIEDEDTLALWVALLIDEVRSSHLVLLLSQRTPPQALARTIAAGRLVELPGAELAFDEDETAALLAAAGRSGEAGTLHRHSGGWPVAAALLLQPRGARHVNALIEHSFWPTLDAPTRAQLEACAWLPTLTADDVDARQLDELADRALLVDRCSVDPPRWRLHDLLAGFLRDCQRSGLDTRALAERIAQAARRLEQRGEPDAAVALWREAAAHHGAHWHEAQLLLCRLAPQWLMACRHASLREAVLAVPKDLRCGELWLRLAQAEILRNPAGARTFADEALARLPDDARRLRIECHTLAIATHFQAFDDTRPLAARVAALEALGVSAHRHDASPAERAAVAVAVWSALFLREPGHAACEAWHARVLELLHEPVDPNLKLRAGMLLAKQAWYHGRHVDIAQLPTLLGWQVTQPGVTPYARLLWGLLRQYGAWAAGDWAGGLAATTEALDEAHTSGIASLDQHLRLHGACFASLLGDDAAAQLALDEVAARADASRRMEAWHHFTVRGWLELRRGNAPAAERAARLAVDAGEAMGPAPQAMAMAVRCHALRALGEVRALDQARRELERLGSVTGNALAQIHGLLLDAATALDLGDADGACSHLARALAGARVNALWVLLGSAPGELATLLALALDTGIERDTALKVVRTMRLTAPPAAGEAWPWAVRVRTFGGLRVEVDGTARSSGGKQQKRPLELLQALVALGGRASATRLADLLWPDAEGDHALVAFEAALRRLRRLLGHADALSLSGGVVALNPQRVWVDALVQPAPTRAPFLPEQDAPWAEQARQRHSQLAAPQA